jgi:hypothetical protein
MNIRRVFSAIPAARLVMCLPLLALCAAGCTQRIGDFSIISTGTPQYDTIKDSPPTISSEGADGRLWFLFLPLNSGPTLQEAVDRCIDNAGGGDFIERARIYSTGWSLIVFSYGSYSVIGDVGDSKKGSARGAAPASTNITIH